MSNENHKNEHIPHNHVLAVLDGSMEYDGIARELMAAGFEHTMLFQGEELANSTDVKGEKTGIVTKIVKQVQDHLSEETNYLAQYEEEARRGHPVIAVPAKDSDHAQEVANLLSRHGARNIRFFGALAVADLTPVSNPSARSDESPEVQEQRKQTV